FELGRRSRSIEEAVVDLVFDLAGKINNVLARVAVGRELGLAAEKLFVAGKDCIGEDVGLAAGVVHQVLPLDLVAGSLEDTSEGIADARPAAVAHVEGTR